MARIRTIKPEFWTSEQVVECSPTARLLFIGLWTFSDDGGVHPYSTKRLKMEIFPGDELGDDQVTALVGELIQAKLVAVFEADGDRFLHVTGWKHQKIEKPTLRWPQPKDAPKFDNTSATPPTPVADDSASGRRTVADASPPEWNGMESKGRESKGEESKGTLLGTKQKKLPAPTSSTGGNQFDEEAEVANFLSDLRRAKTFVAPAGLEAAVRKAIAAGCTIDQLRERATWFAARLGWWIDEHRPGALHDGLAAATPELPTDEGWPHVAGRVAAERDAAAKIDRDAEAAARRERVRPILNGAAH